MSLDSPPGRVQPAENNLGLPRPRPEDYFISDTEQPPPDQFEQEEAAWRLAFRMRRRNGGFVEVRRNARGLYEILHCGFPVSAPPIKPPPPPPYFREQLADQNAWRDWTQQPADAIPKWAGPAAERIAQAYAKAGFPDRLDGEDDEAYARRVANAPASGDGTSPRPLYEAMVRDGCPPEVAREISRRYAGKGAPGVPSKGTGKGAKGVPTKGKRPPPAPPPEPPVKAPSGLIFHGKAPFPAPATTQNLDALSLFLGSLSPAQYCPKEQALRDAVVSFVAEWKGSDAPTFKDLDQSEVVQQCKTAFLPGRISLREWLPRRCADVRLSPHHSGSPQLALLPETQLPRTPPK